MPQRHVLPEGEYRVVFCKGVADVATAGIVPGDEHRPVVLFYETTATRRSSEVGMGRLDLPVPLPDAENGSVGTLVHGGDGADAHVRIADQVVPLARPPRRRNHGASMLASRLADSDIVHPRHAGRSSVAAWVSERATRGSEEGDRDLRSFAGATRHPALLTAGLVLFVVGGVVWSVAEIASGSFPILPLLWFAPAVVGLLHRLRESRRRRSALERVDSWTTGPRTPTTATLWWSPGAEGGVVPWVACVLDGTVRTWPVVGQGVARLLDGPFDATVLGDVTEGEAWLAMEVADVLLEPVEPARTLGALGTTPNEVAALDADVDRELARPDR